MKKLLKHENLLLIAIFILATIVLYSYYWFFTPYKLQLLYQNWDGPAYVVIAKTFYNQEIIPKVNTLRVGPEYFAAFFPLYPAAIRLFSFLGYFRSMLLTSLFFSVLFILAFNQLAKKVYPKVNSLLLSLPLILLTPRWFIISHVGSSEPLFLFLITLALIALMNGSLGKSAIFGALAQLARSQGILFFVGICFYYLWLCFKKEKTISQCLRELFPFLLIPIALLGVFTLQYFQYGNFFVFFASLSGYHHLQWPPLKIFSATKIGTDRDIWKESFVFYYLLYTFTVVELFRKKMPKLAFIALAYFLPLPFLVHVDLSRYSLPLLPFCALAAKPLFTHKSFQLALLLSAPAIFVFAVTFISINLSP